MHDIKEFDKMAAASPISSNQNMLPMKINHLVKSMIMMGVKDI